MDPDIKVLQGGVDYNFREAINALMRSCNDAAMLTSRWYDLCNTEKPMDVEISLSNGESMKVPNLAKAIEALRSRNGDIEATKVSVRRPSHAQRGLYLYDEGCAVGTSMARTWDNRQVGIHNTYVTPYNEFSDVGFVTNSAAYLDSIPFLEIPRYIFFNQNSSLSPADSHTLAINPVLASNTLYDGRRDTFCLCTRFTVFNGDPVRSVTLNFATTTSQNDVALTCTLAPNESADFIVWGYRGANTCNIRKV